MLTSFPFGNAAVEIELTGEQIWQTIEGILSRRSQVNGKPVTSFLQVSKGIKIEYNPQNVNGTKLLSVRIGETALDRGEKYQVVTLDFLAGGGDNFFESISEFAT